MHQGTAPVAAIVDLAAVGVGITALIVLHVTDAGLSPVREAVSRYGIGPHRGWYRVQTLAFAVAGACVGAGLATATGARVTAGLCVVFALARAAISWFPMDAPAVPRTVTGRRHGALAAIAFLAVTLAAQRTPAGLRGHAGLADSSTVVGRLMLAALVGMVLARPGAPLAARFGAVERAFYLLVTGWLVTVALLLV